MIIIKNKASIMKMEMAGKLLSGLFEEIGAIVKPGTTTADIDSWIDLELKKRDLVSKTKGYMGYKHASCISINDEVVHGVPSKHKKLSSGDLVKIDICASWKGYCADMARCFFVGTDNGQQRLVQMVEVATLALYAGVAKAIVGNRLSDISAAIQQVVEKEGFGVVQDFAGHGIGKSMHEEPEILNYGKPGSGPILRAGMTFAIEPMITERSYRVYVEDDGWTVKTEDKGWAAHVEDTVLITDNGPVFLTRQQN
jgi:methionyl aminopeptidase